MAVNQYRAQCWMESSLDFSSGTVSCTNFLLQVAGSQSVVEPSQVQQVPAVSQGRAFWSKCAVPARCLLAWPDLQPWAVALRPELSVGFYYFACRGFVSWTQLSILWWCWGFLDSRPGSSPEFCNVCRKSTCLCWNIYSTDLQRWCTKVSHMHRKLGWL